MKKLILTLFILAIPYLVNAQVSKNDLRGKIGISLYGGGNIPVKGDYSSNVKTTDLLNSGSQFGLSVSYFFTKGFGLEGALNAGCNYYSNKYRPAGKDPVWVTLSSTINAIYNFGHLFRNPVIAPVARIGAGSYHWERFEDGIIGGVINAKNKNHKVNSFGFNVGVGAEYFVKKNFTVGLLLDYNIFYPKHEDQLGSESSSASDRTAHSFFAPQLKLSYYIPTRK